jgi:hypothetical protein
MVPELTPAVPHSAFFLTLSTRECCRPGILRYLRKDLHGHQSHQTWTIATTFWYTVCYGKENSSSSISEIDHYLVVINLRETILNIFPISISRWEIQTQSQRTFLLLGCLHKLWRTLLRLVVDFGYSKSRMFHKNVNKFRNEKYNWRYFDKYCNQGSKKNLHKFREFWGHRMEHILA